MYPEWLGYGAGVTNYLAVPDLPLDTKGTKFDLPGGTIFNGDLASVKEIKTFERSVLPARTSPSRSRTPGTTATGRSIRTRRRRSRSTRSSTTTKKYSWVKAPRFEGKVMQVGPLAQVLVGFALGHEPTKRWADKTLETAGADREDEAHAGRAALDARPPRGADDPHVRDLRARAEALEAPRREHRQGRHGDLQRAGVPEGRAARLRLPRGAARHALALGRHRGRQDQELPGGRARRPGTPARATRRTSPGPYEASLVGNPVADAERPLEVLRTVHSFDPCLACAIHTLDPEGREIATVRAL